MIKWYLIIALYLAKFCHPFLNLISILVQLRVRQHANILIPVYKKRNQIHSNGFAQILEKL